ncbi:PapB/FocB family fimbrial expression transcriptional regulator [Pseudomonas serbica]|uniref:PapB/FocB family fimbrial expression transcriptional regulator n=1 Tax=Pseudomonas serbica TaxID=2965074 RepID=UPI00237B84D8|nr:PapB/FocB family fimbrial expression transcriptional regulator [Pseudomonas serbica]
MPKPMKDVPVLLVPGEVSASHFDRLVKKHTDIRSKYTIPAMREHLVNGVSQAEACRMHGASPSSVSVSLDILNTAAGEILELMQDPFYQQALAGQAGEQASA